MDEAHRFSPRPTARQCWGTASQDRFHLQVPVVRCRPGTPYRAKCGEHCRAPRMAVRTAPPDFAPCAGDHLRRQKRHVFCRIPFFRDRRILSRKGGFLWQDVLSRTVRTPTALHPRLDGRTVGMPFRTAPPDELVAAGRHILRRQGCVLLNVPLCREQRKLLHQAALFRRNLAPCAVGAACALAAGVNHGLPRMTAWAGPPDFFVTAESHIIRLEW